MRTEISDVQRNVLDFLRDNPGSTIQKVANQFGVAHATASYHLNTLRRLELLSQEREGREVRHYATADEVSPGRRLRPLLSDPRRKAILLFLGTERAQQFTANQIADRVGVNHGYLMRTLEQLSRLELVRVHRRGVRYVVHASPELGKQVTEALSVAPDGA